MKKIVIIPAYNEGMNLDAVVADLYQYAKDFDLLIVNDGSSDNTAELLDRRGYPHIDLPVNLGIGGAVQAGYLYALRQGYDIACQFDGDGQHMAESLPMMAAYIEGGHADLVLGSRYVEKDGFQSTRMRRLGISFLSNLIWLTQRRRLYDVTSGLRMCNRAVMMAFADYYPVDYPEPETLALALRRGFNVREVAVRMRSRQGGVSSINVLRSAYYMLKVSMAIVIDSFKGA